MKSLFICVCTALTLSLGGLSAKAQNMAILIVQSDYDRVDPAREAPGLLTMAAPLEAAGFRVEVIRDREPRRLRNQLRGLRQAAATADRLIVAVGGHIAHDARDAYVLSLSAQSPDALSLSNSGLSLGVLADLAAGNPGGVLMLAAPQAQAIALGDGVAYGYAARALPEGISVISGRAGALARAVEDAVLEGVPLGQVAARPGLTGHGFLPQRLAFLSSTEKTPLPPISDVIQEPEPAPPTAQEIEQALRLTRTARRDIQSDLSILGYDTRGVDGLFGPGTRRAVTRWQADNRFEATGFLTRNQIDQLARVAAVRAAELEAEERRAREEAERADAAFWRQTGRDGDERGLRAYLARYPDGLFSELAREQLEEMEDERRTNAAEAEREYWADVREADTMPAYEGYLERFPGGSFTREARARMEDLRDRENREEIIAAARAEERQVTANVITRLLAEQRLDAFGYEPGRVDGVYDEQTRRAIRRFQDRQNIEVTGFVTSETFSRLIGTR